MKLMNPVYWKWLWSVAAGFLCFQIVMILPARLLSTPAYMWLLSNAGRYAYDEGFSRYAEWHARKGEAA